jgi:hypothetical protein
MATSVATVPNPAQEVPLDFPYPLPAAPYRELKLLLKPSGTLPISASAFNLQYLFDNFMRGKSRQECKYLFD